MNPAEREEARKGFEEGRFNILVSTSVAEEGIDIPECNITVRYMYIKDMVAKIQTQGELLI